MAKKQFKTESKKILDMMINSVYTNREIFLRELISNASDAIDKLYYKSLTDKKVDLDTDDFMIRIDIDKDNRILKITDNGIGMSEEELDTNLGIIAKSGSSLFKEINDNNKDIIIPQKIILGIGRLAKQKNFECLLESYGKTRENEFFSIGSIFSSYTYLLIYSFKSLLFFS